MVPLYCYNIPSIAPTISQIKSFHSAFPLPVTLSYTSFDIPRATTMLKTNQEGNPRAHRIFDKAREMEKCNKPSVPISLIMYSPIDKRLKKAVTQLRATATTMFN